MCDEAVDDSLAETKFISDWFDTIKTIEEYFTDLYADKDMIYFNGDSRNAYFLERNVYF